LPLWPTGRLLPVLTGEPTGNGWSRQMIASRLHRRDTELGLQTHSIFSLKPTRQARLARGGLILIVESACAIPMYIGTHPTTRYARANRPRHDVPIMRPGNKAAGFGAFAGMSLIVDRLLLTAFDITRLWRAGQAGLEQRLSGVRRTWAKVRRS